MYITMFNLVRNDAEKPRTKRTAKGLVLSGAQGKRARRDSRGFGSRDEMLVERWGVDDDSNKRPVIDSRQAIKDQLDEGQPFVTGQERRQRVFSSSDVAREDVLYTSQSDRFDSKSRAKSRLQAVAVKQASMAGRTDEETGLPLVIVETSYDAWNLCRGPRSVRR